MEDKTINQQQIIDLAREFQRSRVLLTAVELDVFTNLGEGEQSAAQLAETVSADAKGVERLLNALVSLGYLHKEGNCFANTPVGQRFLNQKSPEFIWRLKHAVNQWHSWSTLTEAVKEGTSVLPQTTGNEKAVRTNAFIGSMHYRALQNARQMVDDLGLDNLDGVLDVGGGSGAYAMAFIQAGKAKRATIQDREHVIPLTEKYIAEAGLSDNVSTLAGDYHTIDFGTGFDLVIMSAILHINSEDENARLIERGVAALNSGGFLLIQEFIIDELRTSPPHAAIFSLNMLVGTAKGDTYTERQYRQWMELAGLTEIVRHDFSSRHNILVGKKR